MNHNLHDRIPVIDLFAGPGGLAEGFSAFQPTDSNDFRVCLSIEKDLYAHSTLELRSFFRQFPPGEAPDEYYAYLRKEISRDELFETYSSEAEAARKEAWHAELGSSDFPPEEVDKRIATALGNFKKWVLVGGPPCQAYSTAGRSRNKGIEGYIPEEDRRHFLYREYLRIIARHWPSIFVMENVKGLLSAKVNGSKIFDHILEDLHDPLNALENNSPARTTGYKYRIYSLVKSTSFPVDSSQSKFSPSDYLIMCEDYGIPQARHRLILLGVREDMDNVSPEPMVLQKKVNAGAVLEGLPVIRSGLSREEDFHQNWQDRIWDIIDDQLFDSIYDEHERDVWDCIGNALSMLHKSKGNGRGGEYVPYVADCHGDMAKWYLDPRLKGVCNHSTRAHIASDLHRYLYASCFARIYEKSPTLPDFPKKLWPSHKNAHKAKRSGNFSDRFRVQMESRPSTTIMSHISKDGHYYIHYDASQCRSLTVREAARLQTFPDNYFFEGTRTQQYIQVGNAVPPLLALQIAKVVHGILTRIA